MMIKVARRWLFGGSAPSSWLADVGLTALRVGAGLALALAHGYGKIPPSDGFIGGVESMGFPLPGLFAWAAALAEFVGGLLLAVGLATRPAALFILSTMSVAFFIRHGDDAFKVKELAFAYGLIMVAFLLSGAGRFSIDRLLRP